MILYLTDSNSFDRYIIMDDKKYLYFDTETTDIQTKDIVQLGMLGDNDYPYFNEYFKPLQRIEFGSMAIHHITPEFVEDKPIFTEATAPKEGMDIRFTGESLMEYLQFLADNYIWVAHNAAFDLEALAKKGIHIKNYICTFKLARNMLTDDTGRDLESYSLQYLRYYLGLYRNEDATHNVSHDAMSDVFFLRDLFHYLLEHSTLSNENMMIISKEPAIMRNLTFGKYSGATIEEIAKTDREYLEWVVNTIEDKPDLVWNIKRVLSNV